MSSMKYLPGTGSLRQPPTPGNTRTLRMWFRRSCSIDARGGVVDCVPRQAAADAGCCSADETTGGAKSC
jgi:hypothetical protein